MVFHKAETLAEVKANLLIGYKVVNELVDGVTVPPLPDGLKHYTFMTSILQNHGLELREWLAENGCVCRCERSMLVESADTPVGDAAEQSMDASDVHHHSGGDVVRSKAGSV